jgi:hypothetical protein
MEHMAILGNKALFATVAGLKGVLVTYSGAPGGSGMVLPKLTFDE